MSLVLRPCDDPIDIPRMGDRGSGHEESYPGHHGYTPSMSPPKGSSYSPIERYLLNRRTAEPVRSPSGFHPELYAVSSTPENSPKSVAIMSVKNHDPSPLNRDGISHVNDGYIYHTNEPDAKDPPVFPYSSVPEIDSGLSPDQIAKLNSRRGSETSMASNRTYHSDKSNVSRSRRAIHTFKSHAHNELTDAQKEKLASFSSLNYSPSHSDVYRRWLDRHPPKFGVDRWVLMILIGILIGLMAAMLKQCLTALAEMKWTKTKEFAQDNEIIRSFAWTAGISVILVVISSVSVTFVYPPAAGSGVPEILAYLNGVVVHGTLSLKFFVVKFIALVFAVSSGLPTAIQGPVIAMGGVVGHGVGQFKSKTLGIRPKFFSRFRNPVDRRSFATAGVAAGVAAAFNAPIGGLLFAMEDLASFWNTKLSWQTLFCCGIATSTANMINRAFNGFVYQGSFGSFDIDIANPIPTHISILLPAMALGIVGGILGAIFTTVNVRLLWLRAFLIGKIPHPTAQKFARVLETVLLALLMAALATLYPLLVECSEYNPNAIDIRHAECITHEIKTENYNCGTHKTNENITLYNEIATMMQQTGTNFFNMLTERYNPGVLSVKSMMMVFPFWFLMIAMTAGSAIAGGTFVPLLISGALYGRATGEGLLILYKELTEDQNPMDNEYWSWIDPGFIAILGAGSLLAGVQRLTLSTTVMIIEMTRDINIVIPLLVANFLAKMFADFLCRPLYRYQLEMKAMPYLENTLKVVIRGEVPNLELFSAGDVMAQPVKTIRSVESVATLSRLLLESEHCGFPVIKREFYPDPDDFLDETPTGVAQGLLTRLELEVILSSDAVYSEDKVGAVITPNVDYEDLSVDYITDRSKSIERMRMYVKFLQYQRIYINLEAFVNVSAPKVEQNYSLQRTYSLFRTLGLRHLMVTNNYNRLVGIITRQDLMHFNVQEKLTIRHFVNSRNSLCGSVDKNHGHRPDDTILPAIVISGSTDGCDDENNAQRHTQL